eukprot:132619-Pelagomonas_calceolata.AAC.5
MKERQRRGVRGTRERQSRGGVKERGRAGVMWVWWEGERERQGSVRGGSAYMRPAQTTLEAG